MILEKNIIKEKIQVVLNEIFAEEQSEHDFWYTLLIWKFIETIESPRWPKVPELSAKASETLETPSFRRSITGHYHLLLLFHALYSTAVCTHSHHLPRSFYYIFLSICTDIYRIFYRVTKIASTVWNTHKCLKVFFSLSQSRGYKNEKFCFRSTEIFQH